MSSGLNLNNFDAALKELYTRDRVENMVYADNPKYGLMPKRTDFYGRKRAIPIIYGNPQGRSATFSRAQARSTGTSSLVEQFELTRVKDYAVATIDNETMLASANDVGAFLEAATLEVDGAINSITRSAAIAMYRQGYGEIGIIATGGISSAVVTLDNAADICNFEVGMELDVAGSLTGSVRAYGSNSHGLYVSAVDRDAGTFTCSANVTDSADGIPLAAAGDYIFVRGDHSGSTRTKLAGFTAYCPQSAPSSSPFFGVDRSVDVTRLGGLRLDARSMPIEEALIKAANRVGREGFGIDHYFMTFDKYTELEQSLGSKVQYLDLDVGVVSFRAIRINGPKGEIRVVPDQNCPGDLIAGVKLSMWELHSLGGMPRPLDTDGLMMLRQSADDGCEVRYGYYANVACKAPGSNINIRV
ncbi:MAG: hypothetical protein E6R03_02305 [Hyphomicrobiaceae bacterium]|nr:MAG: hypothetical protein E6R03_02305 [Hyphomicrobiaceae bacterium]